MVVFGSGQGRSAFATSVVASLRRGLQKSESADLSRKMPFMNGHYLMVPIGPNRETGENLVRTRRCDRERKPPYATVHSEIIDLIQKWMGRCGK